MNKLCTAAVYAAFLKKPEQFQVFHLVPLLIPLPKNPETVVFILIKL